jgi:hypothetical protein
MDPDTLKAVISGGTGLLGAAIGASVTLLSASRQYKRQVARDREASIRDREQLAARQCEESCIRMTDDAEHTPHPRNEKFDEAEHQREERLKDAHIQLAGAALYLPAELRERIELLGDLLSDVQGIAYGTGSYGPTHYDSPYAMCWQIRKEATAMIAAFLQGKPLPAPRDRISEYQTALKALNTERDEYYSMIEDLDEGEVAHGRRKEAFYSRHPEHLRQQPLPE